MHSRGLTHAKYMYYNWANWGLLIGITCNMNSGTPITITWRYLNVLEIRYIQRICFLAAISHQSTHYSETLKTTATTELHSVEFAEIFSPHFSAKNIMKTTHIVLTYTVCCFHELFIYFFFFDESIIS